MKKEKNCYNCKYRGMVSGSTHSCCKFITENTTDKALATEIEFLLASGKYKLTFNNEEIGKYSPVKLNKHGVRNGWATWPLNFDPVWVEECVFFQGKE